MHLIAAGRSLYLSESPGAKSHLWFVLTEPHGNPPEVVVAMLRTPKRFTDETTILEVDDHPFVVRRSCVHFSSARRIAVATLGRLAASGRCDLRQDMSADLLRRIRAGLRASPFAVHAIRDYCADRWP
jgi:hypothetical protein